VTRVVRRTVLDYGREMMVDCQSARSFTNARATLSRGATTMSVLVSDRQEARNDVRAKTRGMRSAADAAENGRTFPLAVAFRAGTLGVDNLRRSPLPCCGVLSLAMTTNQPTNGITEHPCCQSLQTRILRTRSGSPTGKEAPGRCLDRVARHGRPPWTTCSGPTTAHCRRFSASPYYEHATINPTNVQCSQCVAWRGVVWCGVVWCVLCVRELDVGRVGRHGVFPLGVVSA
jgi:hypothetical protein